MNLNNLLQIPTSPIGWFSSIIVVILGVLYLISRIRKNDMDLLRQTNEDQEKRITFLEGEYKRVEVDISDLQKRNKTLEDLVVVALKQYFLENPVVAKSMKDIIA